MNNDSNSKPHMRCSTQKLVEKVQRGDTRAFNDLIHRYEDQLLSFIFLRLGPRLRKKIEVEDIFQEAILRVFLSLKDLRWHNNKFFFNWMASIAEHVIKDQVRYHFQTLKRGGSVERETVRQEELPSDFPDFRDPDQASPSKALLRLERFQRLEESLRSLKEEYREIIILARIRGLPIHEIATRMNRSEDAVSMLLLRALRKLKEAFGETDSFHLPPLNLETLLGENGPSRHGKTCGENGAANHIIQTGD